MPKREEEVLISLRRTADGTARTYRDTLSVDEDWDGLFVWRDGNYRCDCNRILFFERAGGVEPDLEKDDPCGYTAFVVDAIVRVSDGALLYSEKEWGRS